ncbi:hypothetical protein CCHL11_09412 [Colletotrichum chlorophyti]|uniref:DUF676 domain-containing protein n=1 Tax=Colletotrichum chlorophyti TaxID=708187 RepID=A0A1Q8R9K6_9PEZI|nr:hypothetical protein CCHL11_09412 [Colletotrichum chlorophyti]
MAPISVYYSLPKDLYDREATGPDSEKRADLILTSTKKTRIGNKISSVRNPDPYYYTGSPWNLLKDDLLLFAKNAWSLPGIVFPLWEQPPARSFHLEKRLREQPRFFFGRLTSQVQQWLQLYFHSGSLDELYPSVANIWDITLHTILVITQSTFLISLPFLSFISFNIFATYVIAFVMINYVVCMLLNGNIKNNSLRSFSSPESTQWEIDHQDEEWIFLNGVAVGKHWLQSNIDRISLTFHRKVTGVHNKTAGIVFDVIQCLLERCLYFGTSDTRTCFALISEALTHPNEKKVVLILHSQGGLEGSIILDWLMNQHPAEVMRRLEVYTFGNAANHFNNPGGRHGTDSERPIRHIEHYANSFDFVSRWGVLHFKKRTAEHEGKTIVHGGFGSIAAIKADVRRKKGTVKKAWNAYEGAVFVRQGSGHQLNQHYLDNMFPLDESLSRVMTNGDGSPLPGTFMASPARVHNDPKEIRMQRSLVNGIPELPDNNGINGEVGEKKVFQVSRLWGYINGGHPEEY